jgi:TolA-binding protein
MEKEIKEVIEKNLPAHVSDVLRKRLDKADEHEKQAEHLQSQLKGERKEIQDLRNRIEKLESDLKLAGDLDKREKEIERRERRMDVHDANLRAEAAEARANEMAGFVGMVFKSPIYRHTATGNRDIPDGSGGIHYGSFYEDNRFGQE